MSSTSSLARPKAGKSHISLNVGTLVELTVTVKTRIHLEKVYEVHNSREDDLPELLKELRCRDQGEYLKRMPKNSRPKRLYEEFTGYELLVVDPKNALPRKKAYPEILKLGWIPCATVRETAAFIVWNLEEVRIILKEGYRIIGFGKDEFNNTGDTPCVFSFVDGHLTLDTIDFTTDGIVTPKDLFLTRFIPARGKPKK